MWFRPRSQPNHETTDRSRVASIRNRIRSKKSVSKNEAAINSNQDTNELNVSITKPITATSNRIRDIAAAAADGSGYVLRSQSGRRLSLLCSDDDDSAKDKNKMLRVDQKYKKNRVTKSSSRNKVVPEIKIEKQNSSKNLLNPALSMQRKVSSTPILEPVTTPAKVKTTRRNTTLNLNALLRYKSFISGSTKKLTSDDFDRLRRKSLGDTGKIRRKSNPDADKKDEEDVDGVVVESKNDDLQTSPSFQSDKLLSDDDDFQSCSEDQVDFQMRHSLNIPDKGYNISSTTTAKKTKTKNKKKGVSLLNANKN
ncbi:uncharacterized protein LOC129576878 [Sitodiplosis mosellana]|uniref:uncharacterized protein LOC129576878 n=1 Tax=Sitodiplosis mosellana TaxID=263140 RepID=UPI0024448FB0|nr:uncharacterized protein LOC129576878 [Sitodiplosis mosellana]